MLNIIVLKYNILIYYYLNNKYLMHNYNLLVLCNTHQLTFLKNFRSKIGQINVKKSMSFEFQFILKFTI